MGTSLRVGGTMEIAGLDESITMRRVNRIIAAACRYLPDFTPEDFRNISPWHGLRPVTPDGLPFVGRTGRYANLSVAAGHAMMGFSLGPITGKLISEVLAGSSSSININLLSPDRYR
jgi:D-amino-acid dehydrogenase